MKFPDGSGTISEIIRALNLSLDDNKLVESVLEQTYECLEKSTPENSPEMNPLDLAHRLWCGGTNAIRAYSFLGLHVANLRRNEYELMVRLVVTSTRAYPFLGSHAANLRRNEHE